MASFHQSITAKEQEFGVSSLDRKFAEKLDELDELKEFRNEFLFPEAPEGKRSIYLCGNSLGLQPKNMRKEVNDYLDKWAREGVEGHFTGEDQWVDGAIPLKPKMSKLVGAKESEVVIMNSLTANLHLMMVSFYKPTATRYKILIEKKAFPSDYHAVISQLHYHGYTPEVALVEVAPREGEYSLRPEDIEAVIRSEGPSIALILLSGIQYFTGQLFDMATITKLGHEQGCLVGFDLAHAIGNVPLYLHDWGCDFACWCMYKYMNCGPGAIAGCFVHERHNAKLNYRSDSKYPVTEPIRFAGWWGHRPSDRFAMEPIFIPSEGADGFQLSNPPMIAVVCAKASLDVFDRAGGMEVLRKKSLLLTGYLEHLLQQKLRDEIQIITPESRGSHLSLIFSATINGHVVTADEVLERLKQEGVIGDVRKPNVIRITPTALYNSFVDAYDFVEILASILKQ